MTGSLIFFFVLAALLIASSLVVVFQRNVVHSAMALVAALFLLAILFVTLDAPMIGILQILVYAGAIMVLFLFVIMLLNPGALEQRRASWWGFGSLAALLLGLALVSLVSHALISTEPVTRDQAFGSPEMLAHTLFTEFVLPFEVASILLLVAIVGAVVLAKREP